MKVIKHLKHETPEYKFRQFFKQMPLITRILIPLTILATTLLLILGNNNKDIFNIYSCLDVRPISQMILFVIVALTDYQREEKKGSIFFVLSFIVKVLLFAGFNKLLATFLVLVEGKKDIVVKTSYPLIFCIMIAYRDMVLKANQQRYFLFAPFQIKNLFYPIFLALLLQFLQLRIDVITSFFISIILTGIKLDDFILWISKKLDKKILGSKAISLGIMPTGCTELAMAQVDRVTTNNSIVLEQN